jgi:hypothetical protein
VVEVGDGVDVLHADELVLVPVDDDGAEEELERALVDLEAALEEEGAGGEVLVELSGLEDL